MHLVEYEKLLWNRKQLDPSQLARLEELDREDVTIGNAITRWWVMEVICGWMFVLLVLGTLFFSR